MRLSCDGCYTAKVKCSKTEPVCSRCLTCGIECRFSPSVRHGKKGKSEEKTQAGAATRSSMSPHSPVDPGMTVSVPQQPFPPLFVAEAGWNPIPGGAEQGVPGIQPVPILPVPGIDMGAAGQANPAASANTYSPSIPWPHSTELPLQFPALPVVSESLGTGQSGSYDVSAMSTSMPLWGGMSATFDVSTFSPTLAPNPGIISPLSFSSPLVTSPLVTDPLATGSFGTALSAAAPSATGHLTTGPLATAPLPTSSLTTPQSPSAAGLAALPSPTNLRGSCTCFTACLQSLQALHNVCSPSSLPDFETTLTVNRKAVEGCASMLGCTRCMSRSGTHTASMLLATVIGKITSLYKCASQRHFENGGQQHQQLPQLPSSPPGLEGMFASLREDKRCIEFDVLARDLDKLQQVFAQFAEVCGNLSEDPELTRAMIGHLNHKVGSTLEAARQRGARRRAQRGMPAGN